MHLRNQRFEPRYLRVVLCALCLYLGELLVVRLAFVHKRFLAQIELSVELFAFLVGSEIVALYACAGGRFIEQVYRLIGQVSVRDIPLRERDAGHYHVVAYLYLMMLLVVALYASEQLRSLVYCGFEHRYRLEAAFERAVLFDVLAVFVEGGSADDLQLASRQRGLEHVGSVHRAFAVACADEIMHLVDEDYDVAEIFDLLDQRFHTALELPAELSSRYQRRKVEQIQLLVLKPERNFLLDDPLCDALGDCGLADTRLTDKAGVVLGAAREYLNDPFDLLVSADYAVKLAVLCAFGEVGAERVEELALFRVCSLALFLSLSFTLIGSFLRIAFVRAAGAVSVLRSGSGEEALEERGYCAAVLEAVNRVVVLLVEIFIFRELVIFVELVVLDVVIFVRRAVAVVQERHVRDIVKVYIRKPHLLQIVVHLRYVQLLRAFETVPVLEFLCAAHARHKHNCGSFAAS